MVFDAIARTRSVTDAANELALSQPAVSHALRRLREMVGDQLFLRSGKGLLTTPRAEAMAPLVSEWLQAAKKIVTPDTFDPATTTQRFRIGTSDFGMMTMAPGIVRLVRKWAPVSAIEFAPVGADLIARITRGDIDVAFFGVSPPDQGILSQEIFTDHFVGLVGASHPLALKAKRGKVSLTDYLAFPHVGVSFGLQGASPVDAALKKLGRARKLAMLSPNFGTNIAALAGTDLVMTLPSRMATGLHPSDVVSFKLPVAIPAFPYLMIWSLRSDADPASRWLRELIVEAASSQPVPDHSRKSVHKS